MIDHAVIERLHAAGRRERAQHVYRLMCRAGFWFRSFFLAAASGFREVPCC